MSTSSIRLSTASAGAPPVGRIRSLALVLVALAIGVLFALPGLPGLFTAWSNAELEGAHRMHHLAEGGHALVILAGAIALLRSTSRIAGAAQLLVGVLPAIVIAAAAGMLPGVAAAVLPVILLAAVVALLPQRDRLLAVRPSAPLLAVAGAASVALGVFAAGSLRLQQVLPSVEPHAAVHHWAGMGIFAVTLAGLALLAALRLQGWRLTLWTATAMAGVWGTVSMVFPAHPSSLGLVGGLAAAAAAIAFAAVGETARR